MSEWNAVTMQDVVSKIGDGLHGTPKFEDNGDYYFINGNNLSNGDIIIKADTRKSTEVEFLKFDKNLGERTLLLSINGTLGNVAYYQGEKCILGKSACFLNVLDDVDKDYIYYILTNNHFQNYIDAFAHGTTIKNVSLKTIREYSFLLPPLPEQKAIAGVLSSLDDKIDLLHRQNKTLEAMAEALFRQWFVEGANNEWHEGSLLELIQLIGGGTPKTSVPDFWDGKICWISGGDIATNHKSFILGTEKFISEDGLNNSSAKLLPKYSTVISARGTVGKYCLLAEPMAFSQSNYGILPKTSNCFFFVYLLINHIVEELQSSAYGSVFDTITTYTFKEIKVLIPFEPEILKFEKSISHYFFRLLDNKNQISSLEKLRDTLLPKLMNGEVRVSI
ncbi:MAG: restriction endonuclease subunit S [Ignavibacteriaceae bacterium]|nr:restriction endonuclease subunit S [Ignavibacteriaceae bacterium]